MRDRDRAVSDEEDAGGGKSLGGEEVIVAAEPDMGPAYPNIDLYGLTGSIETLARNIVLTGEAGDITVCLKVDPKRGIVGYTVDGNI